MKESAQHFTRGGPLSPDFLVSLLMYLVSEGRGIGYRHVISAFWHDAASHGHELPTEDPISAPGFCKARRKLKPKAIQSLLREVGEAFDRDHGSQFRFKGRRLLAVDGAKISTKRSTALWQEFDGPEQGFTPQAMVSTLFDVLGKMPIHATVTGYRGNERNELIALLDATRPGDVLILDRGYPSFDVISTLLSRGLDFVIRVSTKGTFTAVEEFLAGDADDALITLSYKTHDKRDSAGPIIVRAVRREGPDGGDQAYLTSLRRPEFSRATIIDLYRRRWEVETFYGLIQAGGLSQQQYHAKTPDGVRQEVYATLLYVALTRTLMAAAASNHDVAFVEISMKGAVLAVGRYLTRLLLSKGQEEAQVLLEALLKQIVRVRDKKRPGRSFPRVSHKPQPRWNPQGRSGAPAKGEG